MAATLKSKERFQEVSRVAKFIFIHKKGGRLFCCLTSPVALDTNDIIDGGKRLTYIVTGANSGLGLETVKGILQWHQSCGNINDLTIILAVRNEATTKTIVDNELGQILGPQQALAVMKLDLSDFRSIKEFVEDVKTGYSSIDCLVCNAGVLVPNYSGNESIKTRDGFEINVGVNHLGHFLLTKLLLDHLSKSEGGGRVVVVSSTLLKGVQKIDLSALNKDYQSSSGSGKWNYSISKLMNALFVRELSKRSSLSCYSVSPGWCRTQLHRHSNIKWYSYVGLFFIGLLFLRSPKKGAETIVSCATDVTCNLESGRFYRNKEIDLETETWLDSHISDEETRRLFDLSDQITAP